ncbi:MAG: histidine phosphatase family protein [Methylophilaceae bacterium]|jgi:probable phosphoglycerate mutase|nr:histidine phosphatase family protein [Methyloradius sp.]
MRLFVVRHGQTWYNAERRYLGALDPVLNEVGIQQAYALKDMIPEQIKTVISSPLARARQTAEIICNSRGLSLEFNASFRERNVGVFEGLTQQEAQSQFPGLWNMNITRQWHAAPPNGETIAEVIGRVGDGLQELSEKHPYETVLLVAHGFVAKIVRALVQEDFTDLFDWQLKNGAVYELTVPSNWIFNQTRVDSFYLPSTPT